MKPSVAADEDDETHTEILLVSALSARLCVDACQSTRPRNRGRDQIADEAGQHDEHPRNACHEQENGADDEGPEGEAFRVREVQAAEEGANR